MQLQGRNLSRQTQGDDVKLLRNELRQLGYSISSTQGNDLFDEATYQAVLAFQRSHGLNPIGVVDEATAAAMSAIFNETFTVQGTVWRGKGKIENALVRAYDKDLRHEQWLGETVTDSDGWYTISYTRLHFRRAEKKRADLIVRVFDPDAPSLLLEESDLFLNAEQNQTVDLIVKETYSEYEKYLAILEPVRDNVPIPDLTDTDLIFLAMASKQSNLYLLPM